MTRLTVVGGSGERSKPMVVEAGDRVLDVCDENGAPILFSCRTANCGVCRVDVIRGDELLSRAGADEREVLAGCGAGSSERLACQLIVTSGEGEIQLRALTTKPQAIG